MCECIASLSICAYEFGNIIYDNGFFMSYRTNIPDFIEKLESKSNINKNKDISLISNELGGFAFRQETIRKGLEIVEGNYKTNKDLILDCVENTPLLELHFNLSQAYILYKNSFIKSEKVASMSGNMIYIEPNNSKSELIFSKDKNYLTFDVHFPITLLSNYFGIDQKLDAFLNQIQQNKSVGLTENNIRVSPRVLAIIKDIKHCIYKGLTRKIYIESKVQELISLCFENIANDKNNFKFSDYDISCIHNAGKIIRDNINNPLTIENLSKKVGLNQTKLKNGFKHIFNSTVFNYMQEIRMNKAKQLILDTDFSIEEISEFCGYSSISNFSIAFKNYFGYAPSFLR